MMHSSGRDLVRPTEQRSAFFAKGFRPFFLLASAGAAFLLFLWMLAMVGAIHPGGTFGSPQWHAHEMVFGFSSAVIAGFLLTAVGNWTGRETLTGVPLAALCALWLAGRVAMLVPDALPYGLVAAIDLAFLPALAIAIMRPLVLTGNKRNFMIVGVVFALWLCNVAVHASMLRVDLGWRRPATIVSLDIVVLLIVIFAGRVFPMFTRNATRVESIRSHPPLDIVAMLSMLAVVITDALFTDTNVPRIACGIAAAFVLLRSVHWGARHSLRNPMLWILHASHMFIPLGLALRAIPSISPLAGTHALGVGAIGGATLGMMARVALGHTGRLIEAPRAIGFGFGLLLLGAVVRVVAELGVMRDSMLLVAGALWTFAFLIYVVSYARILTSPRIDGKPG